MTDRDLREIEERLNALSRVVRALADKAKLDDGRNSIMRLADLSDIRMDVHLGRDF